MTSPRRYDPGHGWRLDRIPGQRVEPVSIEGEPDRFFLPLMVMLNGKMRGDSGVWLSTAEAEQLHAELCHALSPEDTTPKCLDHRRYR